MYQVPNMQNTNTIKLAFLKTCIFCVCNFLSIKSIFYSLTYYFLTRFLVTTSVFNRASPTVTSSALSSIPILEYP